MMDPESIGKVIVPEEAIWALTILGFVAIADIIYLIASKLKEKGKHPAAELTYPGGEGGLQPQTTENRQPRRESESQRLTRKEKELAEREARVKAKKLRELGEREAVIRRKEAEDKPPAEQPQTDKLTQERKRLEELIRKAEQRFAAGELTEENFKRIVSGYQEQIIKVDIEKHKRGGGI